MDKTIHKNTLAERVVLGSILLEPTLMDKMDNISLAAFSDFKNISVFKIYLELHREGTQIDLVTVTHALRQKGLLEKVGSRYVPSLADEVPTSGGFEHHVKIINTLSLKRITLESLNDLQESVPNNPLEIHAELEKITSRLGDSLTTISGAPKLRSGSELSNLEIKVEWLIKDLLPKEAITLFHGRGGIGKTWLAMQIAKAIERGESFMGLDTQKVPVVYVDFENSLPVLIERVNKVGVNETQFWHGSDPEKPPRLDTKGWRRYKALPEGALLIVDSLRASQGRDENDSREMGNIMGMLKELRDAGFTIFLIHHTPKYSDRTYKGSTAILDMADHVLALHRVKKGQPDEIIDDDDSIEDCLYRFGTKDKTRYHPHHIHLAFDKMKGGFKLATDPDDNRALVIHQIITELKENLCERPNQTQITERAQKETDFSVGLIRKLLKKYEGLHWKVEQVAERKNQKLYSPTPVFHSSHTIYSEKPENSPDTDQITDEKLSHSDTVKNVENIELASFSDNSQKTEKQPIQRYLL